MNKPSTASIYRQVPGGLYVPRSVPDDWFILQLDLPRTEYGLHELFSLQLLVQRTPDDQKNELKPKDSSDNIVSLRLDGKRLRIICVPCCLSAYVVLGKRYEIDHYGDPLELKINCLIEIEEGDRRVMEQGGIPWLVRGNLTSGSIRLHNPEAAFGQAPDFSKQLWPQPENEKDEEVISGLFLSGEQFHIGVEHCKSGVVIRRRMRLISTSHGDDQELQGVLWQQVEVIGEKNIESPTDRISEINCKLKEALPKNENNKVQYEEIESKPILYVYANTKQKTLNAFLSPNFRLAFISSYQGKPTKTTWRPGTLFLLPKDKYLITDHDEVAYIKSTGTNSNLESWKDDSEKCDVCITWPLNRDKPELSKLPTAYLTGTYPGMPSPATRIWQLSELCPDEAECKKQPPAWVSYRVAQPSLQPNDQARFNKIDTLSQPLRFDVQEEIPWSVEFDLASNQNLTLIGSTPVRIAASLNDNEGMVLYFSSPDLTISSPEMPLYEADMPDTESVPNERDFDVANGNSLFGSYRLVFQSDPLAEPDPNSLQLVWEKDKKQFYCKGSYKTITAFLPADRALIDPVSVTRGNLVGELVVGAAVLKSDRVQIDEITIEGDVTKLIINKETIEHVSLSPSYEGLLAHLAPKEDSSQFPAVTAVITEINEENFNLTLEGHHSLKKGKDSDYNLLIGPARLAIPRDVNHGSIPLGLGEFRFLKSSCNLPKLKYKQNKVTGTEVSSVLAQLPWVEWGPSVPNWLQTGKIILHHRNLILEHSEFESSFKDRFPDNRPPVDADGNPVSPMLPFEDFIRAVRDPFTEASGNLLKEGKELKNFLPGAILHGGEGEGEKIQGCLNWHDNGGELPYVCIDWHGGGDCPKTGSLNEDVNSQYLGLGYPGDNWLEYDVEVKCISIEEKTKLKIHNKQTEEVNTTIQGEERRRIVNSAVPLLFKNELVYDGLGVVRSTRNTEPLHVPGPDGVLLKLQSICLDNQVLAQSCKEGNNTVVDLTDIRFSCRDFKVQDGGAVLFDQSLQNVKIQLPDLDTQRCYPGVNCLYSEVVAAEGSGLEALNYWPRLGGVPIYCTRVRELKVDKDNVESITFEAVVVNPDELAAGVNAQIEGKDIPGFVRAAVDRGSVIKITIEDCQITDVTGNVDWIFNTSLQHQKPEYSLTGKTGFPGQLARVVGSVKFCNNQLQIIPDKENCFGALFGRLWSLSRVPELLIGSGRFLSFQVESSVQHSKTIIEPSYQQEWARFHDRKTGELMAPLMVAPDCKEPLSEICFDRTLRLHHDMAAAEVRNRGMVLTENKVNIIQLATGLPLQSINPGFNIVSADLLRVAYNVDKSTEPAGSEPNRQEQALKDYLLIGGQENILKLKTLNSGEEAKDWLVEESRGDIKKVALVERPALNEAEQIDLLQNGDRIQIDGEERIVLKESCPDNKIRLAEPIKVDDLIGAKFYEFIDDKLRKKNKIIDISQASPVSINPVVLTSESKHNLSQGDHVHIIDVPIKYEKGVDSDFDHPHLRIKPVDRYIFDVYANSSKLPTSPNPSELKWIRVDAPDGDKRKVEALENKSPMIMTTENHGLKTGDTIQVFGLPGSPSKKGDIFIVHKLCEHTVELWVNLIAGGYPFVPGFWRQLKECTTSCCNRKSRTVITSKEEHCLPDLSELLIHNEEEIIVSKKKLYACVIGKSSFEPVNNIKSEVDIENWKLPRQAKQIFVTTALEKDTKITIGACTTSDDKFCYSEPQPGSLVAYDTGVLNGRAIAVTATNSQIAVWDLEASLRCRPVACLCTYDKVKNIHSLSLHEQPDKKWLLLAIGTTDKNVYTGHITDSGITLNPGEYSLNKIKVDGDDPPLISLGYEQGQAHLAVADNASVKLYDFDTHEYLWAFGYTNATSLAVASQPSPNPIRILVASADNTLSLWARDNWLQIDSKLGTYCHLGLKLNYQIEEKYALCGEITPARQAKFILKRSNDRREAHAALQQGPFYCLIVDPLDASLSFAKSALVLWNESDDSQKLGCLLLDYQPVSTKEAVSVSHSTKELLVDRFNSTVVAFEILGSQSGGTWIRHRSESRRLKWEANGKSIELLLEGHANLGSDSDQIVFCGTLIYKSDDFQLQTPIRMSKRGNTLYQIEDLSWWQQVSKPNTNPTRIDIQLPASCDKCSYSILETTTSLSDQKEFGVASLVVSDDDLDLHWQPVDSDNVALDRNLEPDALRTVPRRTADSLQLLHRVGAGTGMRYDIDIDRFPCAEITDKGKEHKLFDLTVRGNAVSLLPVVRDGRRYVLLDESRWLEPSNKDEDFVTESLMVLFRPTSVVSGETPSIVTVLENRTQPKDKVETRSTVKNPDDRFIDLIRKKGASGIALARRQPSNGPAELRFIKSPFYAHEGDDLRELAPINLNRVTSVNPFTNDSKIIGGIDFRTLHPKHILSWVSGSCDKGLGYHPKDSGEDHYAIDDCKPERQVRLYRPRNKLSPSGISHIYLQETTCFRDSQPLYSQTPRGRRLEATTEMGGGFSYFPATLDIRRAMDKPGAVGRLLCRAQTGHVDSQGDWRWETEPTMDFAEREPNCVKVDSCVTAAVELKKVKLCPKGDCEKIADLKIEWDEVLGRVPVDGSLALPCNEPIANQEICIQPFDRKTKNTPWIDCNGDKLEIRKLPLQCIVQFNEDISPVLASDPTVPAYEISNLSKKLRFPSQMFMVSKLKDVTGHRLISDIGGSLKVVKTNPEKKPLTVEIKVEPPLRPGDVIDISGVDDEILGINRDGWRVLPKGDNQYILVRDLEIAGLWEKNDKGKVTWNGNEYAINELNSGTPVIITIEKQEEGLVDGNLPPAGEKVTVTGVNLEKVDGEKYVRPLPGNRLALFNGAEGSNEVKSAKWKRITARVKPYLQMFPAPSKVFSNNFIQHDGRIQYKEDLESYIRIVEAKGSINGPEMPLNELIGDWHIFEDLKDSKAYLHRVSFGNGDYEYPRGEVVYTKNGTDKSLTIECASNTSPIKITTPEGEDNDLQNGDIVGIKNVKGNTAANGEHWRVRCVDKNSFEIYHDCKVGRTVTGIKVRYAPIAPLNDYFKQPECENGIEVQQLDGSKLEWDDESRPLFQISWIGRIDNLNTDSPYFSQARLVNLYSSAKQIKFLTPSQLSPKLAAVLTIKGGGNSLSYQRTVLFGDSAPAYNGTGSIEGNNFVYKVAENKEQLDIGLPEGWKGQKAEVMLIKYMTTGITLFDDSNLLNI